MAFEIDTLKLVGHYDTDTGKVRTANIYYVDGIDRELTLAELVMAICLSRAAEMESGIIDIMRKMQDTNIAIDGLSRAETIFVNKQDDPPGTGRTFNDFIAGITPAPTLPEDASSSDDVVDWLTKHEVSIVVGDMKSPLTKDNIQAIITAIESKLDTLNSFSQQKMIELQSETNKRNQAYDLISSMVKSIGTANQAIGSNFR